MSSSEKFVTVVSGVPRSGTSMMMQMLEAGGMPILTDHLRTADDDNQKGYYELEAAKQTRSDPSWVLEADGKAVKVIYALLPDLPQDTNYRVLFMQRDLNQVVASQREMLKRRNETGANLAPEQMADSFRRQLDKIAVWLKETPNFTTLYVEYQQVLTDPTEESRKIADFLYGALRDADMVQAVDTQLNHHR